MAELNLINTKAGNVHGESGYFKDILANDYIQTKIANVDGCYMKNNSGLNVVDVDDNLLDVFMKFGFSDNLPAIDSHLANKKYVDLEAAKNKADSLSSVQALKTEIQGLMADDKAELLSADTTIKQLIDDEVQRAKAAEAKNAADIIAEGAASRTAETELNTKITNLTSTVTTNVNSLNVAITGETTRAKAMEASLESKISENHAALISKHDTLENEINSEVQRSLAAEKNLTGIIAAEEARAKTAENSLSARITSETDRAVAAEEALANVVESNKNEHKILLLQLDSQLKQEVINREAGDKAEAASRDEAIAKAINDILNGAPEALDTIREIAKAIQDDQELGTQLLNRLTEVELSLEAEVSSLLSKINSEISRATAAELSNKELIDGEKARAITREDALLGGLLQEVNRAKTAEGANASAISEEVARATKLDEEIKDSVSNETLARIAADTQLRELIQIETDRATSAETSLTNRISNEEKRSIAAEEALQSDIADLDDRSQVARSELTSKINSFNTSLTALINENSQNVLAEERRAIGEENKLKLALEQEVTDRRLADDVINSTIVELTEKEKINNANLSSKIDDEINRATGAEVLLTSNLNAVSGKVTNNYNELKSEIQSEKDRAMSAESNLQKSIDAEKERAINQESILSNEITSKFNTVDSKLTAEINNRNAAIEAQYQKIIGAAPGALDTLNEIATALGDDPNLSTTLTNKINDNKTLIDGLDSGKVNRAGDTMTGKLINTASVETPVAAVTEINLGGHWKIKTSDDGRKLFFYFTEIKDVFDENTNNKFTMSADDFPSN